MNVATFLLLAAAMGVHVEPPPFRPERRPFPGPDPEPVPPRPEPTPEERESLLAKVRARIEANQRAEEERERLAVQRAHEALLQSNQRYAAAEAKREKRRQKRLVRGGQ